MSTEGAHEVELEVTGDYLPETLNITNGDGKLQLIEQLLDLGRIRPITQRPTFKLVVTNPYGPSQGPGRFIKVECHVDGVIASDGTGETWTVEGYVVRVDAAEARVPTWLIEGSTRFRAGYNTRHRSGILRSE